VRVLVTGGGAGLGVLVNNAGVGAGGRFERIPLEDWDWIWEINLKGVVRGCRTFVPLLAAIMNLPAMSSYNVTKAGVLSLSETLRLELEPYGVHTTVVCPAYFRTSLGDRLRSPDPGVAVLRPVSTSGCREARDSHVPSGRQPHLRGTGRDPATGTRRSRRYRHVVTTRVNSGEAESA
jgi:NAD(P)-dependent dehydrogenase (short-subunit alcohol dehydrogenase family)